MSTRPQVSIKPDSTAWVWDSTWLPAVVVHRARGSLLVRLDHGVTFSATIGNLIPRDPAFRGGDLPSASPRRSNIVGCQQRGVKEYEPRRLERGPIARTL